MGTEMTPAEAMAYAAELRAHPYMMADPRRLRRALMVLAERPEIALMVLAKAAEETMNERLPLDHQGP